MPAASFVLTRISKVFVSGVIRVHSLMRAHPLKPIWKRIHPHHRQQAQSAGIQQCSGPLIYVPRSPILGYRSPNVYEREMAAKQLNFTVRKKLTTSQR
jgi:hypothetical protein